MVPALGFSAISAGYGLLKMLTRNSSATAFEASGTGQDVPAGEKGRAESARSRMFDRFDANGDGTLSRDEFRAGGRQASQATMGALLDIQAGDSTNTGTTGALSGLDKRVARILQRIDGDKDGVISKEELAAALESMKGRRHAQKAKDGEEGKSPIEMLFAALDANGDKGISADEIAGALTRGDGESGRRVPPGVLFALAAQSYGKTAAATGDTTVSTGTTASTQDTAAV